MADPIVRRPTAPTSNAPRRSDARADGATPPRKGTDKAGGLDAEQQSAYDILVSMLKEWGLQSLAPEVLKLLQEGRTLDQVSMLLQDTDTYKQRFAGNEARRKAGLPVLSPKEYLQTEAAYRQIMESAGLPKGFYDHPNDFAGWIGNDVSPAEIQSRVGLAVDAAQRLDDGTKRAFREFYGIQPTDLAAFFLDRERALPQIQKIARGARIGGAGFAQGLNISRAEAERLATSELVPDAQIGSAIGRVATLAEDIGKLGGLYGQGYDQAEAEQEVFFGDERARRKRRDLTDREIGQFSGSGGVGKGSLSESPGSY